MAVNNDLVQKALVALTQAVSILTMANHPEVSAELCSINKELQAPEIAPVSPATAAADSAAKKE
jgi:hypothetical protein